MRVLFIMPLICQVTFANILHVPADYPSIQAAYDATSNMDTVLVERGVYVENLLAPEHSTWLMSNYAFTLDSTDINETILDGNLENTVLTLQAEGEFRSSIDGISVTRGQNVEMFWGCALHLIGNANLTLSNSVIRNNMRGYLGRVINVYGGEDGFDYLSDIKLNNVSFHDNGELTGFLVRLKGGTIALNRIRLLRHESPINGGLVASASDSLVATDIVVNGLEGTTLLLKGERKISVENVQVTNCSGFECYLGGDFADYENMLFDSLFFGYSETLTFGGDSLLLADSITISNCYRPLHVSLGAMIGFSSNPGPNQGLIRNIQILNNTVGSRPEDVSEESRHMQPRIMFTSWVNMKDCIFRGNTVHVWGNEYTECAARGSILEWQYKTSVTEMDTSRLQYCIFEDNFVDNHNDHAAYEHSVTSFGKTLLVQRSGGHDNRCIEIDHLIFRNNRQPNHIPENSDPMSIEVAWDFYLEDFCHEGYISVHDILMEDIDDGGMLLGTYLQPDGPRLELYNIILRRVKRQGLLVGNYFMSEGSFVSNILIDRAFEQDAGPVGTSYQHAFVCGSDSLDISNVTIMNCDFAALLNTDAELKNFSFWNNSFDYVNNPYWFSGATFNHCYADFELEGEGNIYGTDPQFDPVLGAPYLLPTSPLIDAGISDAAYNDLEDFEAPGYALWPSQGGLRNDIGYTGGPRAALPDTQWVDLPKLDPDVLLVTSFHLGNPYPNPFNPITQIPFILTRPAEVDLTIYDLLGRKMTTLVDGSMHAGAHVVPFHGGGLASGMYLAALVVDGEQVSTRKMLLLK